MTTNDTFAPADAALARRFADSCYNQDHLAPDRAGMLRLQSLGLSGEVAPGRFAETAALRAAGF
jgi:hypothetical protein